MTSRSCRPGQFPSSWRCCLRFSRTFSRNVGMAPTEWRQWLNWLLGVVRLTGWSPFGRRVGALRAPRLEPKVRTCDPCLRRGILELSPGSALIGIVETTQRCLIRCKTALPRAALHRFALNSVLPNDRDSDPKFSMLPGCLLRRPQAHHSTARCRMP